MKTVVSIYPRPISESKPGLIPSVFDIPAGSPESPQILHVSHAVCPIYAFDGKSIPQTILSEEVAGSIVRDFINGAMARREDAYPGIFYVDGHLTVDEIKKKYADKLKEITEIQTRWLGSLVELADDDWSQNKRHKNISELQRLAAQMLNLNREWLKVTPKSVTTCPSCSATLEGTPVVCMRCNFILDEARYKTMKFATR